MAKGKRSVLGVEAPSVRPTAFAALLVASLLSVPVFLVLTLVDAIW